jgi:hypothetical protein
MQPLPILTLREGALVGGAVVAGILFLWFLARLSHRPYLVFNQADNPQLVLVQLGRIADALDRIAQSAEKTAPIEEKHSDAPGEEKPRAMSAMSMSMFGR